MKIKEEIFLAVVGMTPQILTECLYYYYHDYYSQNRRFDRIKVFTTNRGLKKLKSTLFDDKRIEQLEIALDLPINSIPFTESDIILFKDDDGNPIEDLRSNQTTDKVISLLYDEMNRWTKSGDNRITATVSGGRKTMSSAMALAFQLYAREQDELIHIMVPDEKMDYTSTEAENWFFPSDPNDPEQKLDVMNIPIIKVGRYLGESLSTTPEKLFNKIQKKIIDVAPIEELIIDKGSFKCKDETLKLPPNSASYLRYFIRSRLSAKCPSSCIGCKQCFILNDDLLEVAKNDVLREHELISGKYSGHYLRAKEERNQSFTKEALNGHISVLNKKVASSNLSSRLKSQLTLRSLKLDSEDLRLVWKGVPINSEIVEFND